jgi:hypothetical protein
LINPAEEKLEKRDRGKRGEKAEGRKRCAYKYV